MRSKKFSFLLLAFLLLTPYLKGCAAPMVPFAVSAMSYVPLLAVSGAYVYYNIPRHLELEKDTARPFARDYEGKRITSILADDRVAYEGLDGSGIFEDVKITGPGTAKPRITDEAAKLAQEYGTDGYFMMEYSGMAGSGEYGRSRIRLVNRSGEVVYDQTIRIVRKGSAHSGKIPTPEEVKKMAVQGFFDDLSDHEDFAIKERPPPLAKIDHF